MRTSLVTGGAAGIGLAIARRLVERGDRVVIVDRDEEALASALRSLSALPNAAGVAGHVCDVSDAAQVEAVVGTTVETEGHLDVLVNNAGISIFKELVDHTDEDWQRTLQVNLSSVFYFTRACVPHLAARDGAAIVNIASIAAFYYTTVHSAYAASKAGLVALTRDAAYELGPKGIRVNAVAPGPIRTPLTDSQLDDAARRGWDNVLRLGRWGEPEDIAAAVDFLSGNDSGFITGVTLPVSGGADLRVAQASA